MSSLVVKGKNGLDYFMFTKEVFARDHLTVLAADFNNFQYRLWKEDGTVEKGYVDRNGNITGIQVIK